MISKNDTRLLNEYAALSARLKMLGENESARRRSKTRLQKENIDKQIDNTRRAALSATAIVTYCCVIQTMVVLVAVLVLANFTPGIFKARAGTQQSDFIGQTLTSNVSGATFRYQEMWQSTGSGLLKK